MKQLRAARDLRQCNVQLFALALLLMVGSVFGHENQYAIVNLHLDENNRISIEARVELDVLLNVFAPDVATPLFTDTDPRVGVTRDNEPGKTTGDLAEDWPGDLPGDLITAALPKLSEWLTIVGESTRIVPLSIDTVAFVEDEYLEKRRIVSLKIVGDLLPSEQRLKIVSRSLPLITTVNTPAAQSSAVESASKFLRPHQETQWITVSGGASMPWVKLVTNYLAYGFTHIIPKGVDHLLFVIALVLLSPQLKALAIQVSLFTVAHSVTLALSMLQIIMVPATIVEPLIALSIVYVCVENLVRTALFRSRTLVVVLFGVLHGLGFASVLSTVGLVPTQFFTALISFNIGIELAQLLVMIVFFWLLSLAAGNDAVRRRWLAGMSSLLVGLSGAYMLTTRLML